MRACSLIAERRMFYAKLAFLRYITKYGRSFKTNMPLNRVCGICCFIVKSVSGSAEQRRACGACDSHPHRLADVMPSLVEHHHLVLLRSSAQLLAAALAESLHEDVELAPLVAPVSLSRQLRLQMYHKSEAKRS